MLLEKLMRLLHGGQDDERSQGTLPRRSSTRNYYASPYRRLYTVAMAVLLLVLVVSTVNLISYAADYAASVRASENLREIYHSTDAPTETALPTDTPVPTDTPAPTDTPEPVVTQTPQPTVQTHLSAMSYPDNPYAVASDRFRRLRSQNADIIGWISVDRLIDEAVVQRDNSYYLKRDYLGYHNVNGALFLDENVNLKTRPYTMLVYGHNMQTGAMFGVLRNYENRTFLLSNPFITFDTAYEPGRYVIFAVSTISTDTKDKNFVNLGKLMSMTISLRNEAIASLQRHSVFTSVLDVQADDQILLLVTCVDDPDERRIVCARRIRDGESEDALRKKLTQMWNK